MTAISINPLAEILIHRGAIVESVHRAYVTLCDSDGKILYSCGDPDFVTYPRSSLKPLQALSIITTGAADRFGLTPKHLAIASGSHCGADIHQQTVREMLEAAGLTFSCLKCGQHMPFDAETRHEMTLRGVKAQPIHHNCSGKHAGMLVTAKYMEEDTNTYLEFDHPVQQRINEHISRFSGVQVDRMVIGRDGCSAPAHAISMRAAAYCFAQLIDPRHREECDRLAAERITQSMREHPEMVAGKVDRICTKLIENGKYNLIAKGGAEGYYAAAWLDPEDGRGRGLVVKVEDGIQRGRDPLVIKLLQKFGVLEEQLPENLKQFAAGPIRNHADIEVGKIEVRL